MNSALLVVIGFIIGLAAFNIIKIILKRKG